MKGAVQGLPGMSGIEPANWKAVRQFVPERFGISLSRGSCLNYPHCPGFVPDKGMYFRAMLMTLISVDAADYGLQT